VPGVPELVELGPHASWLSTTDCSGSALADALADAVPDGGADPAWAVRVARSLAEVVAAVHRRGVIHKDVNPSDVVVSAEGQATLIDFDLATTFAEERPVFTHHSEVAGTLPHLAPEQTGRTGRPVDHRVCLSD
jgi:serine/threonine protein kinase